MRFSVAKELITPDWSVSMAGYASRTKTSIGIYDELYSRSLMLDDGNKKLLIISLDVCEADFELVSRIKRLVNAKFGLHEEDIIVHTNHTHAGPVTFAAQCSSSSAVDDAIKYSKLLEEKVMKNVDDCMSSSREGCLEIGTGETCIGMSRRQKTKEGYRIGPNPEEEIDREAYAIVIKDTSEKIHAVLFSCPCHPVVLYPRNLYISGDFPGVACKEMERRYPGSTAMFLQGSGADINPAILAADDDYRDTFYSDVIFTGKALANDISNIILRGTHKIKLSLDTCMERVPLRLNKNTNAETGDKVHDESEKCEALLSVVKLSEDVRIVGVDGEVCNQVGENIRNLFNKGYTLVLGLTNGYIGYICTPKIMQEGGYEAGSNVFSAPFAENTEEIILEHLKKMKSRIK